MPLPREFGAVRQNGYVVPDLRSALAHWTTVLGVGPWYVTDGVRYEDFVHRGVPRQPEVSLALSAVGDLQVELIEMRSPTASLYRDFLDLCPTGGMHHVAFWPDDYDAAVAAATDRGFEVGHAGRLGDTRFVYYETGAPHPGAIVELVEVSEAVGGFFDLVVSSAAAWDGDPTTAIVVLQ